MSLSSLLRPANNTARGRIPILSILNYYLLITATRDSASPEVVRLDRRLKQITPTCELHRQGSDAYSEIYKLVFAANRDTDSPDVIPARLLHIVSQR